jgi:signal transduction histidine kinase
MRENLDRVLESSKHLLGLVNDIMDISKIEAGKMDVDLATANVGTIVQSCVESVRVSVALGVAMTCKVEADVSKVVTDASRIRQIVLNLLSNAAKFTSDGSIETTITSKEDGYRIAVKDTGTGIPEHALESIFHEFHQVEGTDKERKGTGLGLPITRKLCELLGGEISVESEMGQGSVFSVSLPYKVTVSGNGEVLAL